MTQEARTTQQPFQPTKNTFDEFWNVFLASMAGYLASSAFILTWIVVEVWVDEPSPGGFAPIPLAFGFAYMMSVVLVFVIVGSLIGSILARVLNYRKWENATVKIAMTAGVLGCLLALLGTFGTQFGGVSMFSVWGAFGGVVAGWLFAQKRGYWTVMFISVLILGINFFISIHYGI